MDYFITKGILNGGNIESGIIAVYSARSNSGIWSLISLTKTMTLANDVKIGVPLSVATTRNAYCCRSAEYFSGFKAIKVDSWEYFEISRRN